MDKETWSIVLSVAGLLLGLLSAHAQLKSMTRWAFRISGEKARAWVMRMDEDAELYASNSSALIAFITKQVLSILLFLILVFALLSLLRGETFAAPLWVRQALMLLSGIWVGNKLADVSHIVDITLRKSRKPQGRDG